MTVWGAPVLAHVRYVYSLSPILEGQSYGLLTARKFFIFRI